MSDWDDLANGLLYVADELGDLAANAEGLLATTPVIADLSPSDPRSSRNRSVAFAAELRYFSRRLQRLGESIEEGVEPPVEVGG